MCFIWFGVLPCQGTGRSKSAVEKLSTMYFPPEDQKTFPKSFTSLSPSKRSQSSPLLSSLQSLLTLLNLDPKVLAIFKMADTTVRHFE